MVTALKNRIASIFLSSLLLLPLAMPATVFAQEGATGDTAISRQICKGAELNLNADCSPSTDTAATERINNILKLVINIFSLIVGVVSVIMIIVGGLKYITSGGDSGNVTGAKNTILYAVIGLIIVAMAQVIVRFVLSKVSGAAV